MNIRFLKYMFLLLPLGGVNCSLLSGQSPFDREYESEALRIREHLNLITDRSIYVVGEAILFRADHRIEGAVERLPWSTVLYVELVTASGTAVAQGKFALLNGVSTGSLTVPPSALSGNYYLKCYTRWMRNAKPATFSYIPVKIINPNRSEVVNGSNGSGDHVKSSAIPYTPGRFTCTASALSYRKGETISFKLSGPINTYPERLNCCITVVPLGAIDTLSGQLLFPGEAVRQEEFRINYLPDVGAGPSISGSVVNSDQTPAGFTTLHFSLLGEDPEFLATVSDANGRFALSSPVRFGMQELYVAPEPGEKDRMEVRIDQDFDAEALPLLSSKFELSEKDKVLATRLALTAQFSRAYATSIEPPDTLSRPAPTPFYGTRVQRLDMADYVNLPNLEEVFINLVPNVDVLRRKGKPYFKINSENSGIGIYKPLIMIDNITVFDQAAVLALSPEKIDRIDLVHEIYLKGNVAFGGLISIYSKGRNMAGIDLPEGSYFFDYQSFYPEIQEIVPVEDPDSRIPELRNTFLWINNAVIEKGELNEFSFKAPSTKGEYVILVRGVAPDGKILSATTRFSVE